MIDLKLDLPYLSPEKDRHGKPRLYVRRNGRRIRMKLEPGDKGFAKAYDAAVELLALPAPGTLEGRPDAEKWARGTFGALAGKYYGSDEFKALDEQSQKTRRSVIDSCLAEPHTEDDPDPMGNCPVPFITSKKVKRLRDLKVGLPGAANNRKKYLSAMFGWAIEADHMKANPARDVRRKKYASDGFYTWTLSDIMAFENCHAIGTPARLALSILLYLGVRKGDAVKLGARNIHERVVIDPETRLPTTVKVVRFTPRKTRYRRAVESEKPLLPILAKIIELSPCGTDTFIETSFGKPFSAKGFGNWFRDRCDDANLPRCTAHGLRKIGATLCAENGATEREMMAIFDWSTPTQATIYTRAASQRKLAANSMHLLAGPGGLH